jgi:hypothetical protein
MSSVPGFPGSRFERYEDWQIEHPEMWRVLDSGRIQLWHQLEAERGVPFRRPPRARDGRSGVHCTECSVVACLRRATERRPPFQSVPQTRQTEMPETVGPFQRRS